MTTLGVHHVGLTVDDLDAASNFFVNVLGFDVVGEKPAYPARFVSDGTTMLTLWQRRGEGEFDRHANCGLHHLALRVKDQATLERLASTLADERTVQIEFAPEAVGATGTRHMMFIVPGGIRLELVAVEPERVTDDDPRGSAVAFTASVLKHQAHHGSRTGYAKALSKRDWSSTISPELRAFIAERNSFYFGTASANGQPYIQHRGGPPGFLKVLDEHTLAFADYRGNKQYISVGNLDDNDKAFIFLMDYANRRRIKIWGRAETSHDPGLLERVSDDVPAERVIVFHLRAWDSNCPQWIPRKVDVA